MTRGEMDDPPAIGAAPGFCAKADLARYAAAAEAAADPERLMKVAEEAFRHLVRLTVLHGDRTAAAGAAVVVQDMALRLCLAPVASERAARDRHGFVTIILDWAWPRAPAVAGALEACCRNDRRLWGVDIGRVD